MRAILRVVFILCCVSWGSTVLCEVPESAWDVRPVLVGTRVPDISFTDARGNAFSLLDRAKAKPLVLVVYRGLW